MGLNLVLALDPNFLCSSDARNVIIISSIVTHARGVTPLYRRGLDSWLTYYRKAFGVTSGGSIERWMDSWCMFWMARRWPWWRLCIIWTRCCCWEEEEKGLPTVEEVVGGGIPEGEGCGAFGVVRAMTRLSPGRTMGGVAGYTTSLNSSSSRNTNLFTLVMLVHTP